MSVRKKQEKAFPVLLQRLDWFSGRTWFRCNGTHFERYEKWFREIRRQLKEMRESMSRIKEWEKEMVEKLCVLEQDVDAAEGKSLEDLPAMLEKMNEYVGKLKSSVSMVEESVTVKDGSAGAGMSSTSQPEKRQHEVAVSEAWASVGAEDEILKKEAMRRLWASIHCPGGDEVLRMCLLWLAVFPERALIKKRPLIYWWMGEGLVSNDEEGEEVLKQLLEQGFVIIKQGGFSLCPWVRRMLIPLAQELGFFKFSPLQEGGRPQNSERLAFLPSPADADHVLTVFNIDEKYLSGTKLGEWLRGLQRLEVLQLGRWQDSPTHHIEAVDNYEILLEAALASKRHLRYLSLRGISGIETLPAAAIRRLISLRILDLRACHNLERLPHTIADLTNLTHLDVSECYLLESMPKGIRHLLNLQVLKGFVVGTPRRGSCKIADLAGLRQLRKLNIMVRSQLLGSLETLSALCSLNILWMGKADDHHAAAVKLPTSLTSLTLRSVPFKELPEWLRPSLLPVIKKLRIRGGRLTNLPLPNHDHYKYTTVHSLRLQCLASLRIHKDHLLALFPNCHYLEETNQDIILPP